LGRLEGKSTLGRHIRRWEDNIEMDTEGVEWGSIDWIDLVQDRER